MRTSQIMLAETRTTEPEEEFEVFPFTTACQVIWEEGDHVLIGVSPGNSYFSAPRICALAQWAARRFEKVDFVHADLHVDALFAAFGYTPEHAARRAIKEIKAVRRRILRGVEVSGAADRIRVSALSEFTGHPEYRLLRRRVDFLLDHDAELRQGCDAMIQQFLAPRLVDSGQPATAEQLRACRDYIAAELPFFIDTPSILRVPSSVCCYHVVLPLTEVLYGRGGGLRATRNQAYAVVRPERTVRDDRRAA
ncbi:tRNA-dependent cyclodipeptide synthase [Streptantibioticus ferralitis]|uniref:Cyclodipeptide synthase n=1 Tax=Streptantibioticus ferralitis TaxID=236510 RepID=A0ABT5YSE3_9ACTN|nr:tRNA-dependent cyclodipeptide synthase [Streptantibioticus ferralitis]MDF2254420.1 tRNA-dependent cyclodipeptide synthase [Streptantibioticus ferralitis]